MRPQSSCPASSVGFESAVYTALVIAAAVFGAFLLGSGSIVVSLFAVALAGCGLLTTVGVIVAMDTFGPVSDNAQGIAEMSGDVDEAGAQILTELDAVGNTTKAITKGIAIATAVLAATALFGAFADGIKESFSDVLRSFDLTDPEPIQKFAQDLTNGEIDSLRGVLNVGDPSLLVGLIIGSAVVFLFSGLAINAVGRAAGAVVYEVRRQFREIPGIMEGTGRPEYGKVVDICTRDSLRELATPGILAIFAPIAVGFGLGVGPLGAYLAGAIGTGLLMAVFLANAGGAWDNAKKLVEDGNHGGKGSPAHEATIIGDTVGDPFKDTAGPAINPLLKVMNLVALLDRPADHQVHVRRGCQRADPLHDRRRRRGDHRDRGVRLQASTHLAGVRVRGEGRSHAGLRAGVGQHPLTEIREWRRSKVLRRRVVKICASRGFFCATRWGWDGVWKHETHAR